MRMSRRQAEEAADGAGAVQGSGETPARKKSQRKGAWAVLEVGGDRGGCSVLHAGIGTRDDAFTVAAPLAVEGKQVAIALIIPLKVKPPKPAKPTVRLG